MNRPLKIAMIGQRGVPATYGGIEHHVEQLGSRLVKRGHTVSVFCRPSYTEADLKTFEGMDLVHVRTISSKHLEATVHAALSSGRALPGHYDIVHYHAVGPGAFSFVPKLFSRAKVVQTVHGLDGQRAKWNRLAQLFLNGSTWLSARVPDRTVVVSRALADHYARRYRREAHYIPNGVTPMVAAGSAIIEDRHGLVPGQYALFVGRLVPEKAPDLLIRAYQGVATDMPLVIAGGSSFSDEYSDNLRTLAGQDDRIRLVGYVYGQELAELYSNAGLFVLPSALEGLPLTLLEAIGASVPILASDIPPHLEVLGSTGRGGRLFRSGDIEDLARSLTAILGNHDAEKAGAGAVHDRVLAEYDWDLATDQLERLYVDLVA